MALGLVFIFSFSQIVWSSSSEITQLENGSFRPVADPFASPDALLDNQSEPADFLAAESPLSAPTSLPAWSTGLIIEVHEGESIQSAVDGAQSGDLVYVYNGSYHGHFVLKDGVSLMGESREGTILNGDGASGQHVLRALGNNRIENLTVTGSAAYSGAPSSAIRVEGEYVKIRNNNIVDNQGYGLYAWGNAGNVLVEGNLIKNCHIGIQLPRDSNVIRYNTLINNKIGINILSGEKPRIEYNIIVGSTFSAIYEFSWGHYSAGQPSRGYAVIKNNTFYQNNWHATAYGPSIPPAVENSTDGNVMADPQFVNAAEGNYAIVQTSASWGRGAFVPDPLKHAMERASQFWISNEILLGLPGWRIFYAGGSYETFYFDGTFILDTTGPTIELDSEPHTNNPTLTNNAEYDLSVIVDGVAQTKRFVLQEGANTLTFHAIDELGNVSQLTHDVILDTVPPVFEATVVGGAVVYISDIAVHLTNPSNEMGLQYSYAIGASGIFSSPKDFESNFQIALPDYGAYEIIVRVNDGAGNQSMNQIQITYAPPEQFVSYDLFETVDRPYPTNFGPSLYVDGQKLFLYGGCCSQEATYVYDASGSAQLLDVLPSIGADQLATLDDLLFLGDKSLDNNKGLIRVYKKDSVGELYENLLFTLKNPSPPTGYSSTNFGAKFAVVGNILVVSDSGYNYSRGRVYLYDFDKNSQTYGQLIHTVEDPFDNGGLSDIDLFGWQVHALNGRAFIGEHSHIYQGEEVSALHELDVDKSSPTFGQVVRTIPSPLMTKGFGTRAVSMGSYLLVQDEINGSVAAQAGAILMIDANPGSQEFGALVHAFLPPVAEAGQMFGRVSVSGTQILVGAPQIDGNYQNEGAAYLFDGNLGSPTFGQILQTFQNPQPGANSNYGVDVKFVGNNIVVSTNDERFFLYNQQNVTVALVGAKYVQNNVAVIDLKAQDLVGADVVDQVLRRSRYSKEKKDKKKKQRFNQLLKKQDARKSRV